MDLSQLPARERILVTAHALFYRDGIRATGVDRLIAESGVAKLTFYRHFPSKDDLVRAFLDYRHERWMAWLVDALGRHGARPGGGRDLDLRRRDAANTADHLRHEGVERRPRRPRPRPRARSPRRPPRSRAAP